MRQLHNTTGNRHVGLKRQPGSIYHHRVVRAVDALRNQGLPVHLQAVLVNHGHVVEMQAREQWIADPTVFLSYFGDAPGFKLLDIRAGDLYNAKRVVRRQSLANRGNHRQVRHIKGRHGNPDGSSRTDHLSESLVSIRHALVSFAGRYLRSSVQAPPVHIPPAKPGQLDNAAQRHGLVSLIPRGPRAIQRPRALPLLADTAFRRPCIVDRRAAMFHPPRATSFHTRQLQPEYGKLYPEEQEHDRADSTCSVSTGRPR